MLADVIDAKKLAEHIIINVTIKRYNQWLIRDNIGFWLIKLAAWIMWYNIEIVEDS